MPRKILLSFRSQEDMMRLLKNLQHHYCFMVVLWHTTSFTKNNMETALPSLRTVQRAIQSPYHSLSEAQFCFDALVNHLKKYNAPFFVAISEDATRIISRVEYDQETNRMIEFVLPSDDNGLPMADSFLATSFDVIENCLEIMKYQSLLICTRYNVFLQLFQGFV